MYKTINWTSWKKWCVLMVVIILAITSWQFMAKQTLLVNQTQTAPSGAITNAEEDKQEIALTFNVSWGDDVIIDILDVLQETEVKATFFINGEWALREEELAELIVEEQHEVGLLGYSLERYADQPKDVIIEDLENGETIVHNLGFEPLRFVRPPEHEYHDNVNSIVTEQGYDMIFWSVYAHIEKNSEVNDVVEKLNSTISAGDIVLFFAQDNLKQTPEILEQVIKQKKREGYQFVSTTELLSPADVKLTPLD
ncbi:polysaccharide deacetylase family protein [Alkalibacillus sp. S2W]|uniref:polysaccharide deacetylase family protein n=1 Tax=Alkalibacillus sp. S2W TaxID=3386553 RepID=UPI00398D5846